MTITSNGASMRVPFGAKMCTVACDELVKPVVVKPTIVPAEPSVCSVDTGEQFEMSAKNRTWYSPVVLLNFPVKLGFVSTFGEDAISVPSAAMWAKKRGAAAPA